MIGKLLRDNWEMTYFIAYCPFFEYEITLRCLEIGMEMTNPNVENI